MLGRDSNVSQERTVSDILKGLETKRTEVSKRIDNRNELKALLDAGISLTEIFTSSKLKGQNLAADNILYLVEIQNLLKELVAEISTLKVGLSKDKIDIDTVVAQYKQARSIAACFSALERLELSELEENVQMLKGIDPNNGLISMFQNDLDVLIAVHTNLSSDDWEQLKVVARDPKRLMSAAGKRPLKIILEHPRVFIFRQWYQFGMVHSLDENSSALMAWQKLFALRETVDRAIHLMDMKIALDEGELWEVLAVLDLRLRDRVFLNSAEIDYDFRQEWGKAFEGVVSKIDELEKRKRSKHWESYLEACRKALA